MSKNEGTGPAPLWRDEPKVARWTDEPTGLPCLMVRGPFGAWCGYVGLPASHPWHGLSTSDSVSYNEEEFNKTKVGKRGVFDLFLLTFENRAEGKTRLSALLDVHGSLSFAGPAGEVKGDTWKPDTRATWWFGFDCGHINDLVPSWYEQALREGPEGCMSFYLKELPTYRDMTYVRAEVESLARQLAAVKEVA